MRFAYDGGRAGHGRRISARMIKQHPVADLHLVTHEIAGLIIPHTAPACGLPRASGQVLDRKTLRLRFHEPTGSRLGHGMGNSGGGYLELGEATQWRSF